MGFLNFISGMIEFIDFLWHWRFNVCFYPSSALAVVAYDSIPFEPFRSIATGAIVIIGIVIGWRWDNAQ